MQPIQNKWFKRVFLTATFANSFLFIFLMFFTMACQKDQIERIHIKGRIVTKGTGDPILMRGIKFGIYEAQPSRGILTPQAHLLIDSFETDADGMFEHSIIKPEFLENLSVRQISVVPGYSSNPYRYPLVGDLKNFEKIGQYKRIVFEFSIDNRSGSQFDEFTFLVPGSQITTYVGNQKVTAHYNTLAYHPFKMLIADHQKDTQYNIDIVFETLDTARYTFVP